MLAEPLADLCISRPKSRLDWGIEIPFDDKYVTYVWYDALLGLPQPAAEDRQRVADGNPAGHRTLHRQGHPQDARRLLAPDSVAVGLPLFRHLNVHGWINFGGARMSKSSGKCPIRSATRRAFGQDVLRYFVLREVVYGLDGDFTEERVIERYNADLANDLGNLTSRVLSMAARYFQGEIPRPGLRPRSD